MSVTTNNTEVEGSIVHVIHAQWNSTDSVYDRTVLALTERDNLTMTVEESEAEFNPAAERRTRRYRTNNTVDVEISSAIAADLEALELIGLVDANGELDFATSSRRLDPMDGDGEFIEIAYFDAEGLTFADAQLVHRLEDVESTSPEIDMTEAPPTATWTMWVHGTVHFGYTGT